MRPQLNEPKCVITSIEIAMCWRVNYVKWFYTGGYIYHSSTIVHMGQAIAMYQNLHSHLVNIEVQEMFLIVQGLIGFWKMNSTMQWCRVIVTMTTGCKQWSENGSVVLMKQKRLLRIFKSLVHLYHVVMQKWSIGMEWFNYVRH